MRLFLFFTFVCLSFATLKAQDLQAYQLFDSKGKPVTFKKMVNTTAKSDVVFFGELHNNPIAHWLQLELAKALHEKTEGKLSLGAEMFESDNQLLLDEYLSGQINAKAFEDEARVWNNYDTDYKPLVLFAKEQGIPFIATNIPRRYANLVYRGGFEGLDNLSDAAKGYTAPLPVSYDPELPGYKKMVAMMGGHGGDNLPKAQAIKDATMAYFISQSLPGEGVFMHINGSYHSDNKEGIIWYLLEEYAPKSKIMTITTVEQSQLEELEEENQGKADFTLVVTDKMTKTY
jgi:uncharacterized iron-regulated protein